MDAERETVAAGIDRVDQRIELVCAVAHYVQHGAEDFARQRGGGGRKLEYRWRYEQSARMPGVEPALVQDRGATPLDVIRERGLSVRIDDGPYVRREQSWIPDH